MGNRSHARDIRRRRFRWFPQSSYNILLLPLPQAPLATLPNILPSAVPRRVLCLRRRLRQLHKRNQPTRRPRHPNCSSLQDSHRRDILHISLTKPSQFFSEFIASTILMFVIFALKDDSNPGAMGKSGAGQLFPLALFFLIFGLGACFGFVLPSLTSSRPVLPHSKLNVSQVGNRLRNKPSTRLRPASNVLHRRLRS
jgi:hypothetical protein